MGGRKAPPRGHGLGAAALFRDGVSPRVGWAVNLLAAGLFWVAAGVGVWGALWGLAVWSAAVALYATIWVGRHMRDLALANISDGMRPTERLLKQLDNPDPFKQAVGILMLLGAILATAIDSDLSVWALVPLVILQAAWVGLMLIRRRK